MTRARPLETLLAALAVLAACWPVDTLLRGHAWSRPAVLAVLVVAVVGVVLRALRTAGAVVVAAQLLMAGLAVVVSQGLGTGPLGLPGTDLGAALHAAGVQALSTIRGYAAPAPATPGLVTSIALLVVLVAAAVDHLAVARRAAAAAGFPLLAVYLVSAVNTPGSLPPHHFAAAALPWLLLVVEQHRTRLGRWSTVSPRRDPGRASGQPTQPLTRRARRIDLANSAPGPSAVSRLAAAGRVAAVLAVVGSLALQSVLPQPRTTFLADGLGRQEQQGDPSLSFSSDVDITRSLESLDPRPVLTYRVSGTDDPPPLAVAVATTFADGRWRLSPGVAPGPQDPTGARRLGLPAGLAPDLPHHAVTAHLSGNTTLRAPQLAVPAPVLGADAPTPWRRDPETGLLSTSGQAKDYSVTFAVPDLDLRDLTRSPAPLPGSEEVYGRAELLEVDPAARAAVLAATRSVLADAPRGYGPRDGTYHKAMAIQEWLRSPAFTYSLVLPPVPEQERARGVAPDGVTHFLATRQGYCVQFASTMVMMARSEGIPSRMVVGFLPGTPRPGGTHEVRAADAHAWPELYLDGVGWTRFEPTPGGRSGLPPAYAQSRVTPTATATPTTTRPAVPLPSVRPTLEQAAPEDEPGLGERLAGWFTPRRSATLLALLLVSLALSALPLRAARVRRSRVRAARTPAEAVEARWTTLAEQLTDLGVCPTPAATPRALLAEYAARPTIPEDSRRALGRVLRAVERARYAPPGASCSPTQVEADARAALRGVARTRTWPERLRALLLPRAGRLR